MKQLIVTIIISSAIIVGCGTAKQAARAQVVFDTYGKEEQLADTFLHRLQQENDVVLATYTESLAWGMHYNYTIAVRKNGVWRVYNYTISGTRANAKSLVREMHSNPKAADAALQYLNNSALWGGKDNHETCKIHISDGSTSYLLMAAGGKVLRLSYYMPDTYQQTCPDSSRRLFMDAVWKVRASLLTTEVNR
jgi:hypothetical protein